ncbi:unnamed protein product [Caenorhabditis bovis]|uniref:G-protein coupled receptors family 1 profile domain-containing protein n=1 Tax=Caenorhabditis bovis TaxID=2654633 RepID=A0A8S1EJ32_9PELO|nr:unnamed protein product [Caenorhabditis bovis]
MFTQESLNFSYRIELWVYMIAVIVGLPAFVYTCVKMSRKSRICRTSRQQLVLAARLFSYKVSLTAADTIVLFIYAPTQFAWITSYWWFGGDIGCRIFKFISTFGFHLTANMQVLVAADRLLISAKMNRLNRNNMRRKYNTRLSLVVAWILALICAFPQLVIFQQALTEDGQPQCISIWTQKRGEYYLQLYVIEAYEVHMQLIRSKSEEYFFQNGTMKLDPPPAPKITVEDLYVSNQRWLMLERIYNVIHLATICVLPLTMEFICYILILYILKGASKGNFVTLSDIFYNIFCCGIRKQKTTSPVVSNNGHESDALVMRQTIQFISPDSRSCDMERRRATSVDAAHAAPNSASITVALDSHGHPASSIYVGGETTEPPHGFFRRFLFALGSCGIFKKIYQRFSQNSESASTTGNNTRRQSTPATNRSTSMWVNTVDTARRNARSKAFIMLSLNLIFWAPYCILAITSSINAYEWLPRYQFVNALITFNAVSNIIL